MLFCNLFRIFLFFLGLLSLILITLYEQRRKGIKACINFIERLLDNRQDWAVVIANFIDNGNFQNLDNLIDSGMKVYLLSDEGSHIKIQSLNNERLETVSKTHYRKIIRRLQKDQITTMYNFQGASIYYRLDEPLNKYILWFNW